MKQFKLWQKCLLEVSGELNRSAREKLRDQVDTYPDARIEYEVIRGRYKLLRSLPKPEDQLDPVSLARLEQSFKQSVHKALDAKDKQRQRDRLIGSGYRLLLVASGMAAGLLLVAGLSFMHMESQNQQQGIVDAENTFTELAESKLPMQSDPDLSDLASRIASLQKSPSVESQIGNAQFMTLLDALDQVSDNGQQANGDEQ
jgi:hypothetical protein